MLELALLIGHSLINLSFSLQHFNFSSSSHFPSSFRSFSDLSFFCLLLLPVYWIHFTLFRIL